jgi:hypothetical protein
MHGVRGGFALLLRLLAYFWGGFNVFSFQLRLQNTPHLPVSRVIAVQSILIFDCLCELIPGSNSIVNCTPAVVLLPLLRFLMP